MTEFGKRAGELFSGGYNCAQAVACAFSEHFGMPLDTLAALACPFGGGMAGMRETCGTVSGMLIVIGLAKGNTEPGNKEKKAMTYALGREAVEEFRRENGSVLCRELLEMQKAGTRNKRSCRELCELAADIAAKYI